MSRMNVKRVWFVVKRLAFIPLKMWKDNCFVEFINSFSVENQHSKFLYVYFLFAYYLLLCPFRFKMIGPRLYKVHRWAPQQILCALNSCLLTIRLIANIRSTHSDLKSGDPTTFFEMFSECASLVYKGTVLKMFWRNHHAFEKLINFLPSRTLISYNPLKIESVKVIASFCGLYTILCAFRMIFGSGIVSFSDWSPQWLFSQIVADARFTFFFTDMKPSMKPSIVADNGIWDIFLAIVNSIAMQSRFFLGYFTDLFILMHVLSLWAPTSGFARYIHQQQLNVIQAQAQEIDNIKVNTYSILNLQLGRFEALKTLSFLVGEACGQAITPYLIEVLFDYAVLFDGFFLKMDILTQFVIIAFYICAVSIFFFSAEIVRKMQVFRSWVCDERRVTLVEPNRLASILDELNNHNIGVTAAGVFTIDYSFVGTVCSVLLTYFIIKLQSRDRVVVPYN